LNTAIAAPIPLSTTLSDARTPPGTGILEKIREQLVAVFRQDRLRMELHARQRMLPVP
jgi:hypothetical protein